LPKITVEVSETVYELLSVLGDPEDVLETLIDHAQQGVYRPGSWERAWLTQVFPEDQWFGELEPGDPYGREGCESMFQRPRKEATS